MKIGCDGCFYREKFFDSATKNQKIETLKQELAIVKAKSRIEEQSWTVMFGGLSLLILGEKRDQ